MRAAAERPFRASLSFSSLPPARPRRPSAGVPRPSRRAEGPGGGRACPGRERGGRRGAAVGRTKWKQPGGADLLRPQPAPSRPLRTAAAQRLAPR